MYHSLAEAYQSIGNYLESERWFRTAVEQVRTESKQRQHNNMRQQHKRVTTVSSPVGVQQPTRSDQVAAHLTYARFLAKNVSGSHFFVIILSHLICVRLCASLLRSAVSFRTTLVSTSSFSPHWARLCDRVLIYSFHGPLRRAIDMKNPEREKEKQKARKRLTQLKFHDFFIQTSE